ncbi:hypothetical protein ACWCP6_15735 [Streptomyces sp. NPDC002004]
MDALGYEPTTLAVDDARAKANHVSSQIFDLIDIKEGQVAGGGAGVSVCEEDPDHLYRMQHPWSIYSVPEDTLKRGFQRLREGLPRHGWKIVEYGPNNSRAKTLELTADSETEQFSANIELIVSTPTHPNEPEPKILVNVVSGCFRAPRGTDLDREY